MYLSIHVNITGNRVRLATSVGNVGVLFDSALTMESQVASVANTCYYQIRNIGQIRSCITSGACKILVHALVTSRLDYCNALLWAATDNVETATTSSELCSPTHLSKKEA